MADQPAVRVSSWRIFEAVNGDRHLLAILDHGPVRITSSISSFDPKAAELLTQSGRKYELLAPPEERQPQANILSEYARSAGLVGATDISDALWRQVLRQ